MASTFERPATRGSSRRAHSPPSIPSSSFATSPKAKKRNVDVHDIMAGETKSPSARHSSRSASSKSASSISSPMEMVHSHFTRRSTSPGKQTDNVTNRDSPRDRTSVAADLVKIPVVPTRKFFSKSRNEERPKPQFNVNNIFSKKPTWGKVQPTVSNLSTNKSSSNSSNSSGKNSRTNSPCTVMTVSSANVSKSKPSIGKKTSQVVIKLTSRSVGYGKVEVGKEEEEEEKRSGRIVGYGKVEAGKEEEEEEEGEKRSENTKRGAELKPIKIIVKKAPTETPKEASTEKLKEAAREEAGNERERSAIDLPTPSPPSPLEGPTPDSSSSSTPEPLPQPHLDPSNSVAFKPLNPLPKDQLPKDQLPKDQLSKDQLQEVTVKAPSVAKAELSPPKPLPPKKKFFTKSRNEGGVKSKPQFNAKNIFKSMHFDDEEGMTPAQSSASSDGVSKTNVSKSTNVSRSANVSKVGGSGSSVGDEEEWVTLDRVKKAHQCHELGETESFDEDIQYCLNGLEKGNLIRIRCLSIEQLTSQCMGPEFRMHLRAHDDMPKIISALSDAPKNPDLAFCTSLLMFIYNQDRLTMDIDPNHLSLMLDLLEVKEEDLGLVDKKHLLKAKTLVEQMKSRGYGKFLDPNNLSAGKLALEALLGLTSKRAGDWFKEELRNLKGLDFLMNTIIQIVNSPANIRSMAGLGVCLESDLNKIDRTLRVLEASTFMHEVNQLYVIDYENGSLIDSCTTLLKSCKDSIVIHSETKIYLTTLLSILRVFTNITSESIKGSQLMGTRFGGLFNTFLDTLFEIPSFIPADSRFDLMVLLLCLCINLVEFCPSFRKELLSNRRRMGRLVEILMRRIEEAKETEAQADEILESAEKDKLTDVVNIDTLLNQVVAKSGKHMEHSIIAACVSLLLGCSIQTDPKTGKELIASMLPHASFDPLIDVLRKLHEFAHLADIMTPSGVKRVERILKVFKSSDPVVTANDSIIDLDDETDERRGPASPSLMSISTSFLNDSGSSLDRSKDEF